MARQDRLAGLRQDVPQWMANAGLEWLYRTMLEPRRLPRLHGRRTRLWLMLVATIVAALITLLVSLAAVRSASVSMRRAAQRGTFAMAAFLSIASAMLLQAFATFAMTGLIWCVQLVHYPLFRAVGEPGYAAYQDAHMRLTTLVVGPLMLLEAATALWLLLDRPAFVSPAHAAPSSIRL